MPEICLAAVETWSTIARNLGLVIGGVIALWLAGRRVNAIKLQADTQQKVLWNDRYQKAVEMLGGNSLLVRRAGIYDLESLGIQKRDDYREKVLRVLHAYIGTLEQKDESLSELAIAAINKISRAGPGSQGYKAGGQLSSADEILTLDKQPSRKED